MILAMMPSWIRPKLAIFGGKIVKILWKNREKWENSCSIHIFWYIGKKFCTVVVHILNKDISYDSKLNESTNESFWGKIFKFRAKMLKIHNNDPHFLSTDKSASGWPCTSTGPIWKLKRDQMIDINKHFLSGVYCAREMEGRTPG